MGVIVDVDIKLGLLKLDEDDVDFLAGVNLRDHLIVIRRNSEGKAIGVKVNRLSIEL